MCLEGKLIFGRSMTSLSAVSAQEDRCMFTVRKASCIMKLLGEVVRGLGLQCH